MKCPIDGSELQITDRQGIEIDYCPQCRGVWLDRGELDKIIERSEQVFRGSRRTAEAGYDEDEDYRQGRHGRKKKEGFLRDLLDF